MKTLDRSVKGLFLLVALTLSTVPFASGCTGETDPDEGTDSIEGDGEDDVSLEPQIGVCIARACSSGYKWSHPSCACVLDVEGTGA